MKPKAESRKQRIIKFFQRNSQIVFKYKDIAKEFDLSYAQARRIMNELVEDELIVKTKYYRKKALAFHFNFRGEMNSLLKSWPGRG